MSRLRGVLALVALVVIILGAIVVTRRGETCAPQDLLRVEGPAELAATADGVSVIVSSDEGFTVGALMWVLRIGDTEFALSRYPDFSTNRIEFPIPTVALPRLHDGDGIGIRYGNPTPRAGSGLDAWSPVGGDIDRTEGFAALRVLDDCDTG